MLAMKEDVLKKISRGRRKIRHPRISHSQKVLKTAQILVFLYYGLFDFKRYASSSIKI